MRRRREKEGEDRRGKGGWGGKEEKGVRVG